MISFGWVVLIVLTFVLPIIGWYERHVLKFYWYRWKFDEYALKLPVEGPPVTRELQLVFAAYGGGQILGILVEKDGIQVAFRGGLRLRFIPILDR